MIITAASVLQLLQPTMRHGSHTGPQRHLRKGAKLPIILSCREVAAHWKLAWHAPGPWLMEESYSNNVAFSLGCGNLEQAYIGRLDTCAKRRAGLVNFPSSIAQQKGTDLKNPRH